MSAALHGDLAQPLKTPSRGEQGLSMDRQASLLSIWLQLELCAMAILLTKGEIRCYCDAPQCVATGYMCKSELNACFSKLLYPQDINSPITHGCLDSIPNTATADACKSRGADNGAAIPKLECCHEDMCNYRGLHDVLSHPKSETSGAGGRTNMKAQEILSQRSRS